MQYRCPLGNDFWQAKGQYHLSIRGLVGPITGFSDRCGKKYFASAIWSFCDLAYHTGLYLGFSLSINAKVSVVRRCFFMVNAP